MQGGDDARAERMAAKELRQRQRSQQENANQNIDEFSRPGSERFQVFRKELNATFEQGKHTRELMDNVHTFKTMTVAAKNQASAVEDRSKRIQTLARRLLELYPGPQGPQSFNWARLGRDVSQVFNPPLNVSTLWGPISVEKAVREKAARSKPTQVNVDGAERAQDVTNDSNSDHNEATNARIRRLQQHLEDTHSDAGIDLLELLVNPQYPTQTVENFFDMAFLVRDKRVYIREEDGLPRVVLADPDKLDEATKSKKRRQMVLTMHMKDLKALSNALDEERAFALHRDDALYEAETAQDQVDELLERETQKSSRKPKAKRPRLSGSTDGDMSPAT